ncbi:ATP-binding cassette sub- D member 1 [Orobanche gracilis]
MPSLQLLQLTERGRGLLASRRKALLLATSIVAVGGTAAAFVQSRSSHKKHSSFDHHNGMNASRDESEQLIGNDNNVKKSRHRKGNLRSLQILAAILLSRMGRLGAINIFSLVAIAVNFPFQERRTLIVSRTAVSNRLAKVQGFLFRAAFLRRVPAFLRLIIENILLCFALSTLTSTSKYVTGTLSLRFRKILTKLTHTQYFQNMAYYKISHVDGRISNPEQRIASDIPKFCSELSDLVQEDLIAVTDGLLYTWRLCSYASPKYILWILAYVLGAGATIKKISPAFGKLMSEEQQLEGEYRQLHSRLRTHAETIAFYGGENREEFHIKKKFRTLVQHMRIVLHDHWWFGMIQDFLLKYLGATVAVILIIEPFFSGNLRPDSSTLGRAEMLSNLRYHTSVIISLFQSLGTLSISSRRLNRLSGYADRIHELLGISRELAARDASTQLADGSKNYITEANYIEFDGVKVVTPTGNVLVEDLTLRVEPGSNLLITGPNGSGKSSLFRVLGGLWPLVSGHIVKPGVGSDLNKEIFYVPQRPYTAVGTLRDQLIYPLTSDQEVEALTQSEMAELLKNVDLEYLLDRYPPEKEVNWGDELSLGEQQRLGMARLFYHKPKFAILDECTSAVTTDMEERFCSKVRAMGTSCITISHRPALVAFHDVVLSLDGEGGWSVHYKETESEFVKTRNSETERQYDALTVQRAFANTKKHPAFSASRSHSLELISASMTEEDDYSPPVFPQLQTVPRILPLRVTSMFKILVPTVFDKQGAQLFAVATLVLSRTWISDRIASLNGTTVKYVLEQDKAAFIRLIGVSVLQSAASSFVAPSLRHLTSLLALGWRIRLTKHLLRNYLRKNAYYKVFHICRENVDADQRLTQDLEKLTTDLSGLVTGMVKPTVDILWFTWRMKLLTGRRGVAILYAYMLLGLGFLRIVTPDFGYLTSREQQLEGTFSLEYMHERLRTHAESVAFFGGGAREREMIEARYTDLFNHSMLFLKKKWLFGIVDDFITKQLPHNVTWGLSLLYAMEHKGGRASTSTQGELAHALRFLASVVSQSFLAFGDILELHRKFLELSGGINRIFELEEFLDAAQHVLSRENSYRTLYYVQVLGKDRMINSSSLEIPFVSGDGLPADKLIACSILALAGSSICADSSSGSKDMEIQSDKIISFSKVDIITPSQKVLARQLTCDIVPGKSLLVTGPNGSGKSSIFRVLRGLWPVVNGRLIRPQQPYGSESWSRLFYVPQRPYTCLGTLRDQVIYPLSRDEAEKRTLQLIEEGCKIVRKLGNANVKLPMASALLTPLATATVFVVIPNRQNSFGGTNVLDEHLKTILENVKLLYLLEREGGWDTCTNWEDILSLGEQQRLGMARLFFHKPQFGVLDECTNATSVDVEEHLYRLARDSGITVITSSQRPALIPFHSVELRLIDGDGKWELRTIER